MEVCSGLMPIQMLLLTFALGQTVVDQYDFYHKAKNSTILTQVNPSLFWEDFLTVLLDAQKISFKMI